MSSTARLSRPRNRRVHQIQQSEFPMVAPGLAAFAASAVARSEQQRAQGNASPAARGYSQSPGQGDAGHHTSAARYPQSAGRDAGRGTPGRDTRRNVSSGTSRTSGTNRAHFQAGLAGSNRLAQRQRLYEQQDQFVEAAMVEEEDEFQLEMLELMPAMICHSKDKMIDNVGPW
jgi:hypothetical protein